MNIANGLKDKYSLLLPHSCVNSIQSRVIKIAQLCRNFNYKQSLNIYIYILTGINILLAHTKYRVSNSNNHQQRDSI